jgi:HD superfamily phosphohydrolase
MKTFKDSVHGYIQMPKECVRIIDSPEFQRLRRIKQLAVCDFVFPNATHSRFEHSIGVSHVAGRIIKTLACSQPELGLNDTDVLKIQIAALVHDIGHGPYSHTYERANPEFNHEQNGLEIWNIVKWSLGPQGAPVGDPDPQGAPERGRTALRAPDDPIGVIDKFVQGCFDPSKRTPENPWLYNIINNVSGGIDADRLDYCLRDAQIASVKIQFDLDRIISGLRIVQGEFQFDSKLVGDIFAVHRARFLLFDTIYNHRVVKAVDLMMTDILKLLGPDINPKTDGDDVIYRFGASKEPRHIQANLLINRIQRRSLYQLVRGPAPFQGPDPDIIKCKVTSSYGSGTINPLKKTKFTNDIDDSYIACLCPKTFFYEKTVYYSRNSP